MATNAASDGPVLSVLNKRIRALRKKQSRILQMEESISQGKTLNQEQQEVLRSKPTVSALINQLEKLREPLSSALAQEIHCALQNNKYQNTGNSADCNEVVEDLLRVIYFASLFGDDFEYDFASAMLTRTHEPTCPWASEEDASDDDSPDLIDEKDLDSIIDLGCLLVARPVDSDLSHKNALRRCVDHAKLWFARADQPIKPNYDVTYASLRERLDKITCSKFFIMSPKPVKKAPVEGEGSTSQEKGEGSGGGGRGGRGGNSYDRGGRGGSGGGNRNDSKQSSGQSGKHRPRNK